MIITSHIQKIIQIHPCLLKLSRKQESVMDAITISLTATMGGIKTTSKLDEK
jgi:hypothetical protein